MKINELYEQRFPKSKAAYAAARECFPAGICHDVRNHEPFPFAAERAEGAYVYDIDGGKMLDLWCGHYANILGHRSPEVTEAMQEAAKCGVHLGLLNTHQIKLAEKIKQAVPEMELLRFCTSGTEATMYACRVAKAFTGRELILKIEGGWHGGNTELSYDVKPPFNRLSGAGGTISLPFNNLDVTKDILEKINNNAAAIIIEPVLGSGGGIAADKEYLKMLRNFCDKTGTVLIFDEVITAFRFRCGSIWPLFGIKPDMFTMGKIIGGGLPVGAYGGRKDIMSTIEKQKLIVGGGTYSAAPPAMIAGYKTIFTLEKTDYSALNSAGESIKKGISSIIEKSSVNGCVTGFGSFFCVHFLQDGHSAPVCRPSKILPFADKYKDTLFKSAMMINGVYTMHAGGALSTAHMKVPELEKTLLSAYALSLEMLDEGRKIQA
jgi:glutamate-1-semialdehyde 2,1-aminomutase